jgi:four helix bundle protein
MQSDKFNFENLHVYKRSLDLAINIYQITQHWPKEHLFGLTDQLRRAAYSISLNIAEGSSRTSKEFQHFLVISRGSFFECIPIIEIALNLKLISQIQHDLLYNDIKEISSMLSSLRTSLKLK